MRRTVSFCSLTRFIVVHLPFQHCQKSFSLTLMEDFIHAGLHGAAKTLIYFFLIFITVYKFTTVFFYPISRLIQYITV